MKKDELEKYIKQELAICLIGDEEGYEDIVYNLLNLAQSHANAVIGDNIADTGPNDYTSDVYNGVKAEQRKRNRII